MIRLAVRVAREHAELVLAELMAFAPAGLEEREARRRVEYVLYGAAGELPALGDVKAAVGRRARRRLDDRAARRLGPGLAQLPRADRASGPLRVRPPWEPPREGALDVVIEPGQAFGTGSHATTRLTLELLDASSSRRARSPTGAAAAACSRSRRRSSAGPRCSPATSSPSRSRRRRAGAEANGVDARRHALRRPPRAARTRRPSSPTSSARCCSRSRRTSGASPTA